MAKPVPWGVTQPLPGAAVRPLGELGDRVQRAAARLLWDDVYRPEWITSDITFQYDPSPWNDWYLGHEWTWYADVSGRYLNALVSAAPYLRGGLPEKARQVAEVVFANQCADGHFGSERPLDACDRSQASGTAWMLLALPRYYALTGDERALAAATRLAGWYTATAPYWLRPEVVDAQTKLGSYALIFSNFTHCLDGLAALWEVDPRDQYADVARRVAGAVKSYDQEIHSHHFLSTIRGLLDWYRLTGDRFFLDRARTERDQIASRGLLDTGGVPETFASPATDEGCSEVDWVLVNLKLFALTGQAEYLEVAERALYGHLFLSQCYNGGFGHWTGYHNALGPQGPGAVGRYTEAYWCCSMHGLFGLAEVARHAVTAQGRQVNVNLFVGVDARIALPGRQRLRLTHTGLQYPCPGTVDLSLNLSAGPGLDLRVRLPGHSPLRSAQLDGQAVTAGTPGELALALAQPGDHRLVLEFAPSVRTEPCRRPEVFGDKRSLWYGPMALGSNACLKNVRYDLTPAVIAGLRPRPAARPGAFPSEVEFDLPATDAPDLARTRDRRRVVLYPLAGHGYRKFSYLNYLF